MDTTLARIENNLLDAHYAREDEAIERQQLEEAHAAQLLRLLFRLDGGTHHDLLCDYMAQSDLRIAISLCAHAQATDMPSPAYDSQLGKLLRTAVEKWAARKAAEHVDEALRERDE